MHKRFSSHKSFHIYDKNFNHLKENNNTDGQMVKSIKYMKYTWSELSKRIFQFHFIIFSIMIDNKTRMTQIVKSVLCCLKWNEKKEKSSKEKENRCIIRILEALSMCFRCFVRSSERTREKETGTIIIICAAIDGNISLSIQLHRFYFRIEQLKLNKAHWLSQIYRYSYFIKQIVITDDRKFT